VNVALINEQYKHFFEIVNHVFDLLETDPESKVGVLAIINELVDYGKFHLDTEEKYFKQ
jgi:hemerythrin